MTGELHKEPDKKREQGPMSTDAWDKELADMKEAAGTGPELPDKPLRRPTPPPGGFQVPELPKPGKEKKENEPISISEPANVESSKISAHEVKTALVKSSIQEKQVASASRKPGGKSKSNRLTILISIILLIVIGFSVAAGYHFRMKRGVEYYIAKLKSEDVAIQNYARDSLKSFGGAAVSQLAILIAEGEEREILAAVDTLALIDTKESIDLLTELTRNENPNVKKRALIALGERAAPQTLHSIEEQINSTDHDTRIYAIRALKNYNPRKSIPILLDQLNDKDWRIRNQAAKTLVDITNEKLGIPTSTSPPDINEIIRNRWYEWWEKNKETFEKVEKDK